MKQLDRLAVSQFIGPFILTFAIALFVLVMQFLWKYVDDLVGKGIDLWVLTELLFYASAKLVPLALPLAVLLASIMTMGSFGEHLEITAAKAAGISLLRFMFPLFISSFVIGVLALLFSNYMLPKANLKFSSLLYDIRNLKPSVAIKPGIFYKGLDGFSIRAARKSDDGNKLYDLIVYDHTSGLGSDHVITAKEGSMLQDEEKAVLTLYLINGKQYKEMPPKNPDSSTYQMYRSSFATYEKKFDLSQFKLSRTDENYFRDLKQMLSLQQLVKQMDTVDIEENNVRLQMKDYLRPYFNFFRFGLDTLKPTTTVNAAMNFDSVFNSKNKDAKTATLEYAINQARNVKNYSNITIKQVEFKERNRMSLVIEIYRKFTLAIACVVLFLVGAPLGSIIRKGGLGWPLFYAVLFFILYHVSSIIGEKLAEREKMGVFEGMWLSTFVLLPIGLFLTFKATDDSRILSADFYKKLFRLK
jgi:lipopolysaccharide export system permease protein